MPNPGVYDELAMLHLVGHRMTRCSWLILLVIIAVLGCSTRPGDSPAAINVSTMVDGCLTTLATDKPRYASGETVHIRVLLLKPDTLAPDLRPMTVTVTILNKRTHLQYVLLGSAQDGVVTFAWLTEGQHDSGCHLMAEVVGLPSTKSHRDISLAIFRPAPFSISATDDRTSHARGETATMTVAILGHDGTPASAAILRASLTFGDKEQTLSVPDLGPQGTGVLRVPIPADAEGDGMLTLTADDGANQVTTTRPILLTAPAPVVVWTAAGGALVAALPNRLYMQASDDTGRPLSLNGRIVDDHGATITTITTTHEGRGSCDLTPLPEREYRLVTATAAFPLPKPVTTGVTLQLAKTRIAPGEPLRLTVTSTEPGEHYLTVRRRGRTVGQLTSMLTARRPTPVSIALGDGAPGVLVISATSPDGRTMAECLAYQEPARRLDVRIVADRIRYQPGDTATLTVTVNDEHGHPAQALVGLAVADAGVTDLVPSRDLPPTLPAMALLENEVGHLADSGRYLDRSADGDHALDLLLGTQGWRLLMTDASAVAHATKLHPQCLLAPLDRDSWPLMLPRPSGQSRPALASGIPEPTSVHDLPPTTTSRDFSYQIEKALDWLKLHQSADGSWPADVDVLTARITTWREPDATLATTALALLAFLNEGYDHQTPNRFKMAAANTLTWLLRQAESGRFSNDSSVQGICLCAIAEAFAMTNDPALKPTYAQAVAVLLDQQVQYDGKRLGWPARAADAPICDAEASLYATMGLSSAVSGGFAAADGFAIADGFEGAKRYLTSAWKAANGPASNERSTFPTHWDPRTNQCWLPHQPAAGLQMASILGHRVGDVLADSLCEYVLVHHLPLAQPTSPLHIRQATFAIARRHDARWPWWKTLMSRVLMERQLRKTSGDNAGSWDPTSFDSSARHLGRTATTALITLTLEDFSRFFGNAPRSLPEADTIVMPMPRTIAWEPRLCTGIDGTVTVRLPAGNQTTAFRVSADAIDDRGALGVADATLAVGK